MIIMLSLTEYTRLSCPLSTPTTLDLLQHHSSLQEEAVRLQRQQRLKGLLSCLIPRQRAENPSLKKLSHLSSCIRCSSLVQEETGHLHLAVLCCHVQRTEAFLLQDEIRCINKQGKLITDLRRGGWALILEDTAVDVRLAVDQAGDISGMKDTNESAASLYRFVCKSGGHFLPRAGR